jgi:hypothetical protein
MSREIIEFDELNHIYRVNGFQYPSVTQILKSVGLGQDYSMVKPEVLEWKRDLGQQVHRAIELDILNDLEDYDPVIEPYLGAWHRLRDDLQIEPIYPELAVFSGKYRYCGKMDLFSKYRGNKLAIFDYKNSASVEIITVGAQLSGYEIGLREWDKIDDSVKIDRFAIKFLPEGKLRLIALEDPMDKNTFLWAASLYYRKEAMKYV